MPILRVKRKQHNSSMCLVCGVKNPYGLKTSFYELENGEVVGLFTAADHHQGYPGRMHGGMAAAILDETIGRAINAGHENALWGVTMEFAIRFKKPVPLGSELKVVGRITGETRRTFEGTGEILLKDGTVAATGKGKYLKLPIEKIADLAEAGLHWKVLPLESDPETVEW